MSSQERETLIQFIQFVLSYSRVFLTVMSDYELQMLWQRACILDDFGMWEVKYSKVG